MGEKALKKKGAPEQARFHPDLGLAIADTWWDLGRLLSKRDNDAALEAQLIRIRKDAPEFASSLNLRPLKRFLATAYELLRKKFNREPIAESAASLGRTGPPCEYFDDGQYLDWKEPDSVFWANEYDVLFRDLAPPLSGEPSWLSAAAICADNRCKQGFFIRSRSNQDYCSYNCRMRAYGRDAYRKLHRKRRRKRYVPEMDDELAAEGSQVLGTDSTHGPQRKEAR